MPAAPAVAQQTGFDPHPLRPPATASPRETLRTFLDDFGLAVRDWQQGNLSSATYRAFERATDALDFSSTPNGDSWAVRIIRAMMLREILDRVEVPPDEEIPGVEEVAEKDITSWTIPNTRITLRRIEEGPREGEFLFSARTVEQAGKYYRQVVDLPYKPGAIKGLLEQYLAADRTYAAATERIRNRLRPVSTSSPRWLLQGFLDSVNRAYRLIREAEAALEATPPRMTTAQALEAEESAALYLRRAASGLDLSKVPPAQRDYVGLEAVLKIKEILDRMPLPPLSSVPSELTVAEAREGSRLAFVGNDLPLRWKIPDTELEIAEVVEGERNGEFLFSARTVRNIGRYFADVRDLPYRPDLYSFTATDDYISPEKSENFYELVTATPGYLVPSAHFLGNFAEDLPDSFKTLHADQTIWQWIGLLLTALAVVVVSYGLFRLFRLLHRRLWHPWNHWVLVLGPIAVSLTLMVAQRFLDRDLNLTGEVLFAAVAAIEVAIFAMFAWVAYIICIAIAETIIHSPKIPDESIDASLLRIAGRVAGIVLAVWIFIDGIDELGLDVLPLVASLGVGGLAVALAAQTTIANFIGSVILYTNRPVRVGDFCLYGDDMGTVEEIGLHSTRIRTLERSVVTVPNAEFAQMKLDNLAKRDRRLFRTTLQLRYETTPEQMRCILAKLRELLLRHPMIDPDPARVRFVGYGAYSKDVEIFSYLRCQDQNTFLAMREDVLLRIEDIVVEAGSGFAFPSQTAYLTRDAGLDAKQRDEAAAQVEKWRVDGKLPFPEFAEEQRQQLEDTLDYPPKGSPDHKTPAGQSDAPERDQASTPGNRNGTV
jgi:MscS family membrane protein